MRGVCGEYAAIGRGQWQMGLGRRRPRRAQAPRPPPPPPPPRRASDFWRVRFGALRSRLLLALYSPIRQQMRPSPLAQKDILAPAKKKKKKKGARSAPASAGGDRGKRSPRRPPGRRALTAAALRARASLFPAFCCSGTRFQPLGLREGEEGAGRPFRVTSGLLALAAAAPPPPARGPRATSSNAAGEPRNAGPGGRTRPRPAAHSLWSSPKSLQKWRGGVEFPTHRLSSR